MLDTPRQALSATPLAEIAVSDRLLFYNKMGTAIIYKSILGK
jgi:hypothetical protein